MHRDYGIIDSLHMSRYVMRSVSMLSESRKLEIKHHWILSKLAKI